MIGTKLKALLAAKNINVGELSRLTGVSAQTLYSIIKRDNLKIDIDVLFKICSALDVPPEAFYEKGSAAAKSPEPEEWEMLSQYRALDEHGKETVDKVLEIESRRCARETQVQTQKTARIIPLYLTPAAAGYASPALGDDYIDYAVPADSRADFAARIQGDSMEPFVSDGDVVLVRRESVSDGDIGLFFVDGDMKCKQFCRDNYGNTYLFSLNRRRADADTVITASSGITVCCFGKVITDRKYPLPTM